MKKLLFICSVLLTFSITLTAQVSKAQKNAEKEFLTQLNSILKKGTSHHWQYEDRFIILQPFRIDSNQLSVTLKYTNDSVTFLHRMTMPVKSVTNVAWDMYAILESGSKNVLVYESDPNKTHLNLVDTRNYFHIALVEDERIIDKLRASWEKLSVFYGQ